MLRTACLTGLLAAWLVPCASACADDEHLDWLKQRLASGVFRWGGDAEGSAPYQLRDPEQPGRVIGFEVELADALAAALSRRIGRPVAAEFVQYDWGSLPLGLGRSDFDAIIAGYEITPENSAKVRFSRPYYIYAQQLVTRLDDDRIKTLDDCLALPVGTLSGSTAEFVLQERGVKQIVGYDGQVEPFLDLEFGRLDAVLLDTPIVTFYGATNPKLKLAGPPFAYGEYGVAFRSEDARLATAVDAALGEVMSSGRWQEILRKWRLWNLDQARLARNPAKTEELRGLGFDEVGQALPVTGSAVVPVDANIIAASASRWNFSDYAPLLLKAAGMTVFLTVSSMALAMTLGLIVAICRLYGPRPLQYLALGYVEFFRGIPLLLLLFFLYFGVSSYLSPLGISLRPDVAAILGFGLTYAAYEAEVYRSAIGSVPSRQWDAARALGMSDRLAFRRIIFPQAFRTALGPMTNDFVALFKDTSLVSVIAVRELTKEYQILARSSLKFLELGLLTAALYLLMSVPLGYLSRRLEQRWGPR